MLWMALALAGPVDTESTRDTMAAHWAAVEGIRASVVEGDLEGVRAAAAEWNGLEAPRDEIGRTSRERLSPLFSELAKAKGPVDAARTLAVIGNTCGACHQSHGVARSYVPPTPPRKATAMEHHRAGADWMWAGLVTRSEGLFEVGARTLASANLAPGGLATGTTEEQLAHDLEMGVQDSAARAMRTDKPDERARLYGEMLASCVACHQATKGGPRAVAAPDLSGDVPVIAEMHDRFSAIARGREAIEKGDLDAARDQGRALLELPPPSGLPLRPWRPWVVDVRAAADGLARAETVHDASVALARVAQRCGGCHVTVGGGPGVPDADVELSPLDLLWLALLTGSDDAWARGAKALDRPELVHVPPGESRAIAFGRIAANPASR